jgi:hypothetical protein
MAGDYNFGAGRFQVDLSWDVEQTLLLGGVKDILEVESKLLQYITEESANIPGD